MLALSNFLLYYFLASRRNVAIAALGVGLSIQCIQIAFLHNSPDDLLIALVLGYGATTVILTAMAMLIGLRGKARPLEPNSNLSVDSA